MTIIWAKQALTAKGWQRDVRVEIGTDGKIDTLRANQLPEGLRVGVLLPAPANCHSHTFQRALAGLTEARGDIAGDNFWTWRKLMYRFLQHITPDQLEAIAAFVQMEMLEAGYATNVEFHYLHHQSNGHPYARLGEMAERIMAAADTSGIGLTLLPVLYQFAGCDKRPLGAGQIRFGNDMARYCRLVDEARTALKSLPADSVLGVAPHSLRAVAREDLCHVHEILSRGPVHIHIAEQQSEVAEVSAAWGARSVEWALENLPLDGRWCMIHATQMTPSETTSLAKTGAVAGLCPLTESSLGDGIFDGVRWMSSGGKIAVGSDSNIQISLSAELRLLESTQRLRDHSRAALATQTASTGRRLFDAVLQGGAQAAGRGSGRLETGEWADMLALDSHHVNLEGLTGDTSLDSFIFTGGTGMISDVWTAGRHMVKAGEHIRRAGITAAYRNAVAPLRDSL